MPLFKKTPNILTVEGVLHSAKHVSAGIKDDATGQVRWVPARGSGYSSFRHRCKAAWKVFTGKADALIWPMGQ